MTQVKRRGSTTQELASKTSRSFRSFLLVAQFEAKEIGQRIADARTIAGLTQEALAEMASFSKRSLQDYEAGVTIPYRHMREISRLLAREVEWFLHGEEPVSDDEIAALHRELAEVRELAERILQALGEAADPPAPPKAHAGRRRPA